MTLVISIKRHYVESHIYCQAECNYAGCRYAECNYAECRYAECRGVVLTLLFNLLKPIHFNH